MFVSFLSQVIGEGRIRHEASPITRATGPPLSYSGGSDFDALKGINATTLPKCPRGAALLRVDDQANTLKSADSDLVPACGNDYVVPVNEHTPRNIRQWEPSRLLNSSDDQAPENERFNGKAQS